MPPPQINCPQYWHHGPLTPPNVTQHQDPDLATLTLYRIIWKAIKTQMLAATLQTPHPPHPPKASDGAKDVEL